jgi:hypothetical protein
MALIEIDDRPSIPRSIRSAGGADLDRHAIPRRERQAQLARVDVVLAAQDPIAPTGARIC